MIFKILNLRSVHCRLICFERCGCTQNGLLKVGLKDLAASNAYNLALDWHHNLVDAFPVIGILRLSVDHLKAFEDVYDIIDPPAFDSKLPRALVKVEHGAPLTAVETQEATAELTETLLLATVLALWLQVTISRSG